ncbi:hypothetical protein [Faecalibacterium hattorii]|uniref:Carbohydrate-binding domain-containing protein n=1 Tax=Faecalibacterium hattorii TaxID=2935520 RepID=A0A329U7E2_9FIRM|nr:hypothetical protein [Faecalibacterium hattorii]RAW56838.1 hypothetical protein C4N23_12025 [Faecalibacterium hattorii]
MISYRKLAMRVLGHSPVSAVKTARRSTAKRAAALALTAALVVGMTLPAFADTWYIEDGDISISAGTSGNHVEQGEKKQDETTETIITNRESTASSNTVTIEAGEGKTVDVTLKNVNIDASSGAAVSVTGKGDTNIELNGNNTLTSGSGHAGLEHNKETNSEGKETSGTLTIMDNNNDGKLTANGGIDGAGIGGSDEHDGQVTITGGEITATGGNGAAGIGGGAGDTDAVGGDGDVTISGGTITATGGRLGAGIGGGAYGNGTVTVTDGDITAKATGRYGAGIGGGYGAKPSGTLIGGNGTVTISGGTITEASGGYMAAGIGSGFQGLGTVTIEGDAVIKNAQGGKAGAGIGSGTRGDSNILIRGDAVIENAESSGTGAGIGSGQGTTSYGAPVPSVGNVTIEGNARIENAKSGSGGSGIGGGFIGIGNVIIRGNAQIGNATGGEEGAGIGGGALGTGDVTIEGNVTIENAQGGAGAAGIGGGAETKPDTKDTRNKVSIKSTEAGSPNITATGGGVLNDELAGAAAIGSGSVADGATEVKSDITIEGKVTINATGGGDVAIGDSINGETQFSGLQVGTTITRRNAKGDDVSQPGDVVREQAPTETEAAEAPSTGSVEVERPVTVEGLYVTNVLGKQITHTCTQNGTTLTIRANGIVTSAHLTLGMVRTLKAQGVKTLVFTTLLSRSTTVSVDALLAAEPNAPDETAVVWTHTGLRAALTIDGTDHSALLK